jgi:hypothetical protein
VVIAVCALITWGRANAHPEFNPISTNRYLKLDLVTADEVRLAYSVMVGAGPALLERRRADANSDGKLDEAETRALGEKLRAEVQAHLVITIAGKPVLPRFEAPLVGLAGSQVGPDPFSVDLVARVACPEPSLILDDGTELPQLGETEIRIEESPRTRLVEAHRGKGPGPRESKILFRGPKYSVLEDRSVVVRWEAAQASAPVERGDRQSKHLGLVLAAVMLFAVVVGMLVLRRYRSMKG